MTFPQNLEVLDDNHIREVSLSLSPYMKICLLQKLHMKIHRQIVFTDDTLILVILLQIYMK